MKYLYDPFGRRIGKIFEDLPREIPQSGADGVSISWGEYYGYDREDIVAVYDEAGKIKQTYLHGPGIDEVLIAKTDDGRKNYYVSDHLGSIQEVVDGTGKPVAHYSYDVYGNRDKKNLHDAKDLHISFGYTGREFDAETGLMYYRNRYYATNEKRFLTRDPIKLMGGLNFYGYVGNNPGNLIDPLGLFKIKVCLNLQKLTLFADDGKELFNADTVTGCKDTATPTGKYKLGDWQTDKTSERWGDSSSTPWSESWWGGNVFGPYFVPIQGTDGVGIHGHLGPKVPGSFTAGKYLISSCSHGCIRLSNYDITTLHELMPKPAGTRVEIILSCESQ